MKLEMSQQVIIAEELQLQEVCGEPVLLDLVRETYFCLDESSVLVWRLLQRHRDLVAVRDAMAAEFRMDPVYVEAELLSQVHEFAEAGLVTLKPD